MKPFTADDAHCWGIWRAPGRADAAGVLAVARTTCENA
jgi:hypothetical protein